MKLYIVSTVDRIILVPKIKRSFSNKEDWRFVLSAGKPVLIGDNIDDGEIPMEVAKVYSESYPHVMSIVDSARTVVPEVTIPTAPVVAGSVEFDAVEFLAQNAEPTEEVLTELKQKQLLEICAVLELGSSPSDNKKTLASKIIQEIKVRTEITGEEG